MTIAGFLVLLVGSRLSWCCWWARACPGAAGGLALVLMLLVGSCFLLSSSHNSPATCRFCGSLLALKDIPVPAAHCRSPLPLSSPGLLFPLLLSFSCGAPSHPPPYPPPLQEAHLLSYPFWCPAARDSGCQRGLQTLCGHFC